MCKSKNTVIVVGFSKFQCKEPNGSRWDLKDSHVELGRSRGEPPG
jgi:hypothetical protein